jgi:rsbT antagonist protein RsbS
MSVRIPILKLGEVLIASLQADMTDTDAESFQAALVQRVLGTEAAGVLLDISAMEVVDSFMARVINDTAASCQMLGAEVVVCGVQPAVAITLVEMGRGLIGVRTSFNLEQGLERLRHAMDTRRWGGRP